MKNIVFFSDVHEARANLNKLIDIALNADMVIFGGDGITLVDDYLLELLGNKLYEVRGNCDMSSAPSELILEVENSKIYLTHGDRYVSYDGDLTKLKLKAMEKGCNIALYGHTHIASIDSEDGITMINSGSLRSDRLTGIASYCFMTIDNTKCYAKIVPLI